VRSWPFIMVATAVAVFMSSSSYGFISCGVVMTIESAQLF